MAANRARNTKPELALRSALWREGLRGYRLHVRTLPGMPDLVFPRKMLAIFVHGCYWHRCPVCHKDAPLKTNVEFWRAKLDRNVQRDNEVTKLLQERGYTVFVVWECQIRKALGNVVSSLREALRS